jgi:hypothetical protein
MFGSAILDVAVGLVLVFALVSTICSAIREGIEAWLKTRASFLEFGLRELLRDKGGEGLVRHFFEHPLIASLYVGRYEPSVLGKQPRFWNRGKNLPSYIPSRQFALALFDMAARGPATDVSGAPQGGETSVATLRAGIAKLQNPWVQRALVCALDAAGNDLEAAIANVEAWYDGAMDRVSGWYKRSSQSIILVIALAVVGGMNINAIRVADYLYRDPAVRSSVVEAAKNTQGGLSYGAARDQLDGLELPIGWEQGWSLKPASEDNAEVRLWSDVLGPFFGLLITALAATLGAPFWFDIVNKFMVIRSTVKPREKSREEGSEDRSPANAA